MARPPPFAALRTLEAAVRHLSYSAAARELHVTHGAVSQQIRRLEEELGLPLFHRRGNAMLPTPEAVALQHEIAGGLGRIQAAFDALHEHSVSTPLVLSALPIFATRWLAPRLGRLAQEVEPRLELRVDEAMADMATDGVDCAIRHGEGHWPGMEATLLFGETLIPVCSPAFLARHPIASEEDLLAAPRLRQSFRPWSLWFRRFGMEDRASADGVGLVIDDSTLLVEAAVQGLGVALARSAVAEQDLRAGRLVRPLPGEIAYDSSYFFVHRPDSAKLGRIGRLRDWLTAEFAGGAGAIPSISASA